MRHIESNIQKSAVLWFRLQFPQYSKLLFSCPNGGARNAREAQILKAEGIVPGVSDLILLVARHGYNALCIEFKTPTGRQTQNQIQWQLEAEKQGNKYVICRSFDEFKKTIEEYLK